VVVAMGSVVVVSGAKMSARRSVLVVTVSLTVVDISEYWVCQSSIAVPAVVVIAFALPAVVVSAFAAAFGIIVVVLVTDVLAVCVDPKKGYIVVVPMVDEAGGIIVVVTASDAAFMPRVDEAGGIIVVVTASDVAFMPRVDEAAGIIVVATASDVAFGIVVPALAILGAAVVVVVDNKLVATIKR